jgi:hypothetical protein
VHPKLKMLRCVPCLTRVKRKRIHVPMPTEHWNTCYVCEVTTLGLSKPLQGMGVGQWRCRAQLAKLEGISPFLEDSLPMQLSRLRQYSNVHVVKCKLSHEGSVCKCALGPNFSLPCHNRLALRGWRGLVMGSREISC